MILEPFFLFLLAILIVFFVYVVCLLVSQPSRSDSWWSNISKPTITTLPLAIAKLCHDLPWCHAPPQNILWPPHTHWSNDAPAPIVAPTCSNLSAPFLSPAVNLSSPMLCHPPLQSSITIQQPHVVSCRALYFAAMIPRASLCPDLFHARCRYPTGVPHRRLLPSRRRFRTPRSSNLVALLEIVPTEMASLPGWPINQQTLPNS